MPGTLIPFFFISSTNSSASKPANIRLVGPVLIGLIARTQHMSTNKQRLLINVDTCRQLILLNWARKKGDGVMHEALVHENTIRGASECKAATQPVSSYAEYTSSWKCPLSHTMTSGFGACLAGRQHEGTWVGGIHWCIKTAESSKRIKHGRRDGCGGHLYRKHLGSSEQRHLQLRQSGGQW